MKLEDFVPQYEFRERHSIRIDAPPEKIFDAIRRVRAEDIFLFRTLVAIRRGFRKGEESILNPSAGAALLDVATRTGFRYLANDPPREVVLGIDIAPDVFAAMNFLLQGDELSTETRVHARTRRARLRFGAYWFLIRAGSGFIRRMWLRAIRRLSSAA